MENTIYIHQYASPCGGLMLGDFKGKLCLCDWTVPVHFEKNLLRLKQKLAAETVNGSTELINRAAAQLNEYFNKQRKTFDIPVLFIGTEFQVKILRTLQTVPYGKTLSYAQLAAKAGCPLGVRAVANVNAMNQISVFLPCHRIIGSNGNLTGYGGGLEAKKYLLQLEGVNLF